MEELQAIKMLHHVLLGEKPLTTATKQSSPSTPTPDLTYISSDSDSDSDDNSVSPSHNLPNNEDRSTPTPRYNLRSNRKVTSINTAIKNAD